MFKVICINNKPIKGVGNKYLDRLKEGTVYTVRKVEDTSNGHGKYHLVEVKSMEDNGWSALRFVPTSNIDETEMERNYNFEKVLI